ncbi:MAG: choice-of-anchor J domain-containing protein [Chitinophagaceae bacterium]|nr:choice-of-anchor J domain-containing protein [Chitinophagaceae bacterium]
MKNNLFVLLLCIICFTPGIINSCKKENTPSPPTNIGTAISFTEEFENVNALPTKGWVIKDNSQGLSTSGPNAVWAQGLMSYDKGGSWSGFSAYSYTVLQDEFTYSLVYSNPNNATISSWLVTPVLSIKNGDKFSFYTRGDTAGTYTNRMQVRINNSSSNEVGSSPNSVGGFTSVLMDINAAQTSGGYPVNWTKYEHIFSGINGKTDTRIAFRHFLSSSPNAKGIGIDQFKFQVN